MKQINVLTIAILLTIFLINCEIRIEKKNHEFALAIHGGAGNIQRTNTSPEKEKSYQEKLTEALKAGYEILKNEGNSIEAVEKAINIMENSPLFNAGKGAVFTADGKNELDASIMEGKTLNAGAVAGVSHIKNPISLARLVMEKSPHVLLAREGAESFAVEQGIELVDQKYFFTERRWQQLQEIKEKEENTKSMLKNNMGEKLGTVGAVALDKDGNLAAGTSTGGMTYKKFGRVGDSPIIGAGTYANNNTCAISATGHGEYFIRGAIAHDISAHIEYTGMSLKQAAEKVIMEKLSDLGGTGGVIAMDTKGNISMPFNTTGMYRGYIYEDGKSVVLMYNDN